MITLIHGDDTVSSRKALNELKLKHGSSEIIIFDGSKVTLENIIAAYDSPSLFANQKLIIIEKLISGSKNKDLILEFINKSQSLTDIIFFEQKEAGKLLIKKYFSRAKIIFCQLPQILFKFLDSIGERPVAGVLSQFHEVSIERETEFILSMLIRQWRNLIVASDLGQKGFADAASWQAFKFIKQARFFDTRKLVDSYRQLLSLDVKVKSGLTSYSLNQLLDIFFVSLYYQK